MHKHVDMEVREFTRNQLHISYFILTLQAHTEDLFMSPSHRARALDSQRSVRARALDSGKSVRAKAHKIAGTGKGDYLDGILRVLFPKPGLGPSLT